LRFGIAGKIAPTGLKPLVGDNPISQIWTRWASSDDDDVKYDMENCHETFGCK